VWYARSTGSPFRGTIRRGRKPVREFLFFFASLAGAAVLTALAVILDPKSPVWFLLLWGGGGVFALCALAIMTDMIWRRLKDKKKDGAAQVSGFVGYIPDIRVADHPAVLALFDGVEADKLIPLLEADKITAWGRLGQGVPPF
jgi:hypothetical protein